MIRFKQQFYSLFENGVSSKDNMKIRKRTGTGGKLRIFPKKTTLTANVRYAAPSRLFVVKENGTKIKQSKI